jgi:hypothetical protein
MAGRLAPPERLTRWHKQRMRADSLSDWCRSSGRMNQPQSRTTEMPFLRHIPSKHHLGGVIGRYSAIIEVDCPNGSGTRR